MYDFRANISEMKTDLKFMNGFIIMMMNEYDTIRHAITTTIIYELFACHMIISKKIIVT